jgi:hypothetical protein
MSKFIHLGKTQDFILERLVREGGVDVSDANLFLPCAGEISSTQFDLILRWMNQRGLVTCKWKAGVEVTITPAGREAIGLRGVAA